ncbi:MAG TPA: hypothetical protein GXX77_07240 [Candidatus Cloacimonetes bacterium]|nr:hypothetical protein [Candidatus Cloacimonadota bacterium]
MKRILIVLLLVMCSLLNAVSIRGIRALGEPVVACRLALQMDENTDFQVQKRAGGFYIRIAGFDGILPAPNLSQSFFDYIDADQNGILVRTSENLSYETMALTDTKALVVDFYKPAETKEQRLALARFHTDRGRIARADKIYHELYIDYNGHYDILLAWGELLIKRGSDRASEKLKMIPSSSQFYSRAQELLSSVDPKHIDTSNEPMMEVVEEEIIDLKPDPAIDYKLPEDDDEYIENELQRILKRSDITEMIDDRDSLWQKLNIVVVAAIIVVAILLIFIIVLLLRLRAAKRNVKHGVKKRATKMDSATITKMVSKLLSDGWTNKEIARELKISRYEVEQAIKRLHYLGGYDD